MEPNLQHLWMEGADQRVAGTIRFTQKDNFLYAIEIGNEIMEMEEMHLSTQRVKATQSSI